MRVFALAISVAAATLLGACSGGNPSSAGLLPSTASAFRVAHCPQSSALRGTPCATVGAVPNSGIPSADVAQNIRCRQSTALKDPVCNVDANHPRSTVIDPPALRIINYCDRATAKDPCKLPQSTAITHP
jgi:hypothetical protein